QSGSSSRGGMWGQYRRDWAGFEQMWRQTPPGNHGGIMLPLVEAEIVARVKEPGIHRFDLDPSDAAANCRAIVEAQMMSMRLHSAWMQVKPRRILATGGGSVNSSVLQIMADVMNCRVD